MARKFKITEEQYKAIKESFGDPNYDQNGVTIAAKNTQKGNCDDIIQAAQDAKKAGITGKQINNITVTPDTGKGTLNNSRIITKKDLIENRKRKLKESSTLYQFSDFLRK